jgi:UDP-3-O-[3-hydroxymyristoyl] glucosamine N-acyltransferase
MTADGFAPCHGGDLVILGFCGFGRETAQTIHAIDESRSAWYLFGFLDDDSARHGFSVDGTMIIVGRDQIRCPCASVVVCTGRPDDYVSRPRIVGELALPMEHYATIVHPTTAVSASSSIGPGSVLLSYVALTAAVRVSAHVAIMPQVVLTHDDVVQDFAALASGVRLGGAVHVGRTAYIGAGAGAGRMQRGSRRSRWHGAAVTRDVPAYDGWAGCQRVT